MDDSVVGIIPISDSEEETSSKEEFVPPDSKRAKEEKDVLENTFGEDSETCSICFEPWTSSGSHKVCCLLCGHLFGYSWLKAQGKQGRCPQCNSKATKHDIRILFCRNLRVIDTTERDRAYADLERERIARRKAELDAAEMKAKCELLHAELLQLRDELQNFRAVSKFLSRCSSSSDVQKPSHDSLVSSVEEDGRYELTKSILISSTGNCRVLASCDYLNFLCVSQPSTSPIFKGFGIRKISSIDQRPLKYVHLHTQPIRDLALQPDAQDGVLASVSLDKSLRLTSLLTDQVVQTYHCPAPVWSCCWSADSHRLFAGCSNGSTHVFDIRVTTGPIDVLNLPDNNAPVIALQYLPPAPSDDSWSAGGLLVGQLTRVTFMSEESNQPIGDIRPIEESSPRPADQNDVSEPADGPRSPDLFPSHPVTRSPSWVSNMPHYRSHCFPLEGSLASLSLVPSRRTFMASYRPSQRLPRVRHLLAEIQKEAPTSLDDLPVYSCKEIHNLWAGSRMKMLTRSRLYVGPKEELLAVSGSEDVGGAIVWRCDTGSRFQTLQPPDTSSENPIIDVCPFSSTHNPSSQLALLTEHHLHVYSWQSRASAN